MSNQDKRYGKAVATIRRRDAVGLTGLVINSASLGRQRPPDFIVIGAQKAGTTWLYRNIMVHPQVWVPPAKEINYFNQLYAPSPHGWEAQGRATQASGARDYFRTLGGQLTTTQKSRLASLDVVTETAISDEWYQRIFSFAPVDSVCGEASPDYSVLPRAAIAHVARMQPALRAVLIVRDPIERLWSHARMAQRGGYGSCDLDHLTNEDFLVVYLGRSNYGAMIQRWRTHLGEQNLLVLNYDDIASAPYAILKSFCDHVGVAFEEGVFPDAPRAVGEGVPAPMPADTYDFLKRRMVGVYEDAARWIPEIVEPWMKKHYGG